MKTKTVWKGVLASLLAVGVLSSLAACGRPLTDEPLKGETVADYTQAEGHGETFASGSQGYSWENGYPFNTWWNANNVSYEGGKMSLSLSEMKNKEQVWDSETQTNKDCNSEYYGGEERSLHYYGYGDFEVRMKPAKINGVASTFFTYTGPGDVWYNEDGSVERANPHDEIDIEFLGKNTTKVQFNYFADGKGGHEYMYDLGFDASKEFHNYGYRWTSTDITWFVDGQPVYKVERAKIRKGEKWPENPGRILMNYWCGMSSAYAWMGKFNNDFSGQAEYEWVKTSAKQEQDPAWSKPGVNPEEGETDLKVPTEGWQVIDTAAFDGWGMYEVDKSAGVRISHAAAKSDYNCCGMALSNNYSWVKLKITNNASTPAVLRLDVKQEGVDMGRIVGVACDNENVQLDQYAGAMLARLQANESVDVALKISEEGVNQMVAFLNSTTADRAESGDITLSEVYGIPAEAAEQPVSDKVVAINGNDVAFGGDSVYAITGNADKSELTVHYQDVLGKSYQNISGDISAFVGENNALRFTVKNNGKATAKIRIDIVCTTGAGTQGGNFCNVRASYTGDVVASGNDYPYGGADWVQVAANGTINAEIVFTTGVGANNIMFYIDSSTWDDETTHSGEMVFSAISLAVVAQ